MYQHDLNQKKLDSTLCEVVSECVSAVGVDINTASKKLLRNIAGLNDKKADLIITQRTNNGPFMNREEIKSVKSIGPKTFQQCAGFIRILPDTVNVDSSPNKSKNQLQPLDRTDIHPELYDAAYRITNKCSVNTRDLGTDKFINKIKKWISNKDLPKEAEELGISLENLNIIVDSFTSKLDTDYRLKLGSPIFQKSIKSGGQSKSWTRIKWTVTNVTHFGAFVDLGIGRDALVPNKYMNGMELRLGNLVQVKVMDIDRFKKLLFLLWLLCKF